MTQDFLVIESLDRRQSGGEIESLALGAGVSVLVGRPNTGKTKWLQILDYLLGDLGENPFEGAEESGLVEKYVAAGANLLIGSRAIRIERRWKESGAKTKIFVDGQGMPAREFQQFLLESLHIPLLNFPRGNPMSGQTWPELSFRMLLRHIYRQQRFWGDLADAQPEPEQHACLLQFLGLAERLFTEDYGKLIRLRMEVERLKNRREQYNQTLAEIARDVVTEPGLSVTITENSVKSAQRKLEKHIQDLREKRSTSLGQARDRILPSEERSRVSHLAERRAQLISTLEDLRGREDRAKDRLAELKNYHEDLSDELQRMDRAEDAGSVLADLKITHCPACDQPVSDAFKDREHCFLCHQVVNIEPLAEQLGAVRLHFERDRLAGELQETDELLEVLSAESLRINKEVNQAEEDLASIENHLVPARQIISAFAQEEVSAIDMALGEASERQRQIGRVLAALELEHELTDNIKTVEAQIIPIQQRVEDVFRSIDFQAAAAQIEDGMNEYLNAINTIRPDIWRHSAIAISISRSRFEIRVGSRRWRSVLGGTDTLYFLMAYHYGLLSLSGRSGNHYPGISIIDIPGEFSGEAIEDKENFIIQPFIELLNSAEYIGTQLIVTGASFAGLDGVNRITLTDVHVA